MQKAVVGCTVPFFPKVPIFPGESSEIEVEFNSKGKKGMQTKRITITANTDPVRTFLTMKGEVLKAEEDELSEADKEAAVTENDPNLELNPDCIAVYPNPTSEVLQLRLKEYIGQSANVEIYNDTGQLMLNKAIDRISSESTRFDVSDFSDGIYMITIRVQDKKPFTQCFVVME